jgi:hypothetical protein
MVGRNVHPLQSVAHLLLKDKCFYLCFINFIHGFLLLCMNSEFIAIYMLICE